MCLCASVYHFFPFPYFTVHSFLYILFVCLTLFIIFLFLNLIISSLVCFSLYHFFTQAFPYFSLSCFFSNLITLILLIYLKCLTWFNLSLSFFSFFLPFFISCVISNKKLNSCNPYHFELVWPIGAAHRASWKRWDWDWFQTR